ncbi:MAG: LLM class flavin-dependent oxidoreductase [Dehalococcoidia bacterium]|nr:LLM class flavin-dependent oxidoreductase [Dehalococcoidia bacterium]
MGSVEFYRGSVKIRKDRYPPILSPVITYVNSTTASKATDGLGVAFFAGTAEQHGNYDGWSPFSLGALAGLAFSTRHLRFQSTALPLPQHDPLRVAEDLATLDVISGGRAEGGFGYGYCPRHFVVTGTERRGRAGRLMEGMEVVRLALSQDEFSFHGKHYHYDHVRVRPRPIQKPYPPLWLLGGTSPLGARRAGLAGFPFFSYGMTLTEIEQAREVYYQAAAEAGVDESQLRLGAELGVWVGRTHEEARSYLDAFLNSHEWETFSSYGWLLDDRARGSGPSFGGGDFVPGQKLTGPAQQWVDDQLLCTPAEAVAYMQKLVDLGVTRMFPPAGNPELVMKEVLPHFVPELRTTP